jgi:hypothetical protein
MTVGGILLSAVLEPPDAAVPDIAGSVAALMVIDAPLSRLTAGAEFTPLVLPAAVEASCVTV